MDVAAWLRDLGLERYVSAFRDNDIDAEVLPKLTSVSRRHGAPLDISTWLREPASGATMNWITMWRAISAHILSLGEAGNYLLQAFQANEGNYGGVNLVLRELEQIGRELQAFLNEYESYLPPLAAEYLHKRLEHYYALTNGLDQAPSSGRIQGVAAVLMIRAHFEFLIHDTEIEGRNAAELAFV